MHRRRLAAVAVLGVGWAAGLVEVADRTPADDAKVTHTPVAMYEALVKKDRLRTAYPTHGVVAYRDEVHPDAPEWESQRNQYYLVLQYCLAPVLVERNSDHEFTLVLRSSGVTLERSRSKP